ncbi:hypothetical protein OAW23_10670 [Flavobacteriales bacterium]|nr:hypothetical protein [Flavobacteriales bacterium]
MMSDFFCSKFYTKTVRYNRRLDKYFDPSTKKPAHGKYQFVDKNGKALRNCEFKEGVKHGEEEIYYHRKKRTIKRTIKKRTIESLNLAHRLEWENGYLIHITSYSKRGGLLICNIWLESIARYHVYPYFDLKMERMIKASALVFLYAFTWYVTTIVVLIEQLMKYGHLFFYTSGFAFIVMITVFVLAIHLFFSRRWRLRRKQLLPY